MAGIELSPKYMTVLHRTYIKCLEDALNERAVEQTKLRGDMDQLLAQLRMLVAAGEDVCKSLVSWMEIAEDHDKRQYDYDAVSEWNKLVAGLKSQLADNDDSEDVA